MIGLLARVVIAIAAAGAAYGIYRIITRDTISSEIKAHEVFKDAFKAKYEEKKDRAYTFTVMDEWDKPLGSINLEGDEISSDINIGDEIIL